MLGGDFSCPTSQGSGSCCSSLPSAGVIGTATAFFRNTCKPRRRRRARTAQRSTRTKPRAECPHRGPPAGSSDRSRALLVSSPLPFRRGRTGRWHHQGGSQRAGERAHEQNILNLARPPSQIHRNGCAPSSTCSDPGAKGLLYANLLPKIHPLP